MKLNLPTKLTVARLILVPVCMFFIIYPVIPGDFVWRIVAAVIFLVTSLTDMLDGMLARKLNLVTDIGKLLDPLADKLLIAGALLAVLLRYGERTLHGVIEPSLSSSIEFVQTAPTLLLHLVCWSLFVTIARELAVTQLRAIAAGREGKVIAAGMLGKAKTVTQMVAVIALLVEPALPFDTSWAISYISVTAMTVLTVWSGVDYFRAFGDVFKK